MPCCRDNHQRAGEVCGQTANIERGRGGRMLEGRKTAIMEKCRAEKKRSGEENNM